MRFVIVADNWLPHVCGFTRTYATLVEHLIRQGDEVEVVTIDRYPSVPVPTYPELRFAFARPSRIGTVISSFEPDVVHIALEGTLGLSTRRYCMRHQIPFTTAYTTDWPAYVRMRFPIPESTTLRFLRWFHRPARSCLVANSTLLSSLKDAGFSNVVQWGRGVDLDLFNPAKAVRLEYASPVWLYVGRTSVEKNIEAFLQADVSGTKLVVGTGPAHATLQKKYPKAIFLGLQMGEDLARWYASADCVVFPSKTDTFGLVVLEALASGTPVAAFPVRGPREILEGSGAGSVDPELSTAMKSALNVPKGRCREVGESYGWDRVTELFRHLHQEKAFQRPKGD